MSLPRLLLSVVCALLLAACGGGGGDNPLPLNPSPPPPPPPPPPGDGDFRTEEFFENWGLAAIDPIPAYLEGGTGRGVIVGAVDTGVDEDHIDLVGNIHPASRDIVLRDGASLDDPDGHGTIVAGVIAARRNDLGMHGVAFDAQILMVRADNDASCDDECLFADLDIAAGIDLAVNNGAKIINLSLGGEDFGFSVLSAVRRAVSAGVLVVIAAGNESTADPSGFALVGLDPSVLGNVIIVGATNRSEALADFSNKAGVARDIFMVAPGVDIVSTFLNNRLATASGTSFAAPHVAGAAAVLLDLFPNLSGADLVEILLTSAVDLGEAGVDEIFGHGLLNLAAAIEPIGPTAVPTSASGQSSEPADGSGTAGSAAFGDAFASQALRGILMIDRFRRGYRVDLSSAVAAAPNDLGLNALLARERQIAGGTLSLTSAGTLFVSAYEDPFTTAARRHLSERESSLAGQPQPVARFTAHLSNRTSFSAASGLGMSHLLHGPGPATPERGFLLSPRMQTPFLAGGSDSRSLALGHRLSDAVRLDFAVSHASDQGDQRTAFAPYREELSAVTGLAQLSTEAAGVSLGMQIGTHIEDGGVLGSRSTGALSFGEGARSSFVAVNASVPVAPRWVAFGRMAEGLTEITGQASGLFADRTDLHLRSFAAGIRGAGIFEERDRIGLSLVQPLRVASGKANLRVPVAQDFATDTFVFEDRAMPLSPSGRELDIEFAYGFTPMPGLTLDANVIHQFNVGHIKGGEDATSVVLRALMRF